MRTTGHRIEWNQVKVIDRESVEHRRRMQEAIHIRQHRTALNRDTGANLQAIVAANSVPGHNVLVT